LTDLNLSDPGYSYWYGARSAGRRFMTDQNDKRDAAIKRVEAKRAFRFHLALYGAVNLLLIVVWAITGAGYFWPMWPILGWGIGIAFHYWGVYLQKPITEDEIRREMDRGG